jgi:hypothetical protein
VRLALEELSPSTGLVVSTSEAKNIEPLGSDQWVVEVRAELPGTYRGMLRVYSENEALLEQEWKLEVKAPEISLVTKDFSPQASQVHLGDTITITYTLRNTSPADARQLTFDIAAGDGLTVLERPSLAVIPAQSEAKAVVKLRADRVGSSWVEKKVSSYGAIVQQDRVTVTVTERSLWEQQWFLPAVGVGAVIVVVAVITLRRRGPKTGLLPSQPASAPAAVSSTICPRCGKALTYVQARSQWYRTRCKEYL